MACWRVIVHALDRTGPPVLARSFIRWMRDSHPEDELDLIAFRGGPLIEEMVQLCDVEVLLEPSERWDVADVDPVRACVLSERLAGRPSADATLLVSVAASQALPLLDATGPVVTWVVEQGEDLHWIDSPVGLRERTTRWLAGSESSRTELIERMDGTPVGLAPEFVEDSGLPNDDVTRRCRAALPGGAEMLVVGAGIATRRKAPDLFLEVALGAARHAPGRDRFVWIGGEHDSLHWPVRAEAERLGLHTLRMIESVRELSPWLGAADVLCHTARLDAFPLVCLHAALAGTPVIAFSGAGGVPEMFGDDFVGPPYPDVAGLAVELDRLADPCHREAVADAQRRRVLERYVSDVCAPALLRHLQEVSGRG